MFVIKWIDTSKYTLETLVKKDSTDFKDLIVELDSVVRDTFYLKSYMEGINFEVFSKMVKTDDGLSEKFRKAISIAHKQRH